MKSLTKWTRAQALAGLAAPLLLGGCATSIPSVDVTRFHSGVVAHKGTIVLVRRDGGTIESLEDRTAANAVAAALGRVGFTVLDPGTSEAAFSAMVDLRRQTIQPSTRERSPVSVGVGGSTGSYGSGVGIGIGINLSGKPKPVVAMQLRVQIRRLSDDTAIWEGRAETAAKEGSPAAQPGIAAGKLATALFADYPGPSGKTVNVK